MAVAAPRRSAAGASRDAEAKPFVRCILQSEIDLVARTLEGLDWQPVFHLVMRIDDGDAMVARCRVTLSSLAAQTFSGWRLTLVTRRRDIDFDALIERLRDGRDDARALGDRALAAPVSTDQLRGRILDGFERWGERVDLVAPRPATSFAELSPGLDGPLFIGVVAAGDQLRNDALAEFAVATGLARDAALFYCDEERVNPASGLVEPFCKPQWSPDLLLSTNYIGRLWCASQPVFTRAGGLWRDWLRHGEYDLLLRCTEAAGAIRHLPETLCRRWAEGLDSDGFDSDRLEGVALSRAITRRGIAAEVEAGFRPGFHRVRRRVARPAWVSIIIPTRASRGLIRTCIDTLRRRTNYPDFEIVCVDDIPASDAASKQWLRENADTVIAAEPPFNWSRYNNSAARAATGNYLLFLNDDVEITEPDWLTLLVGQAQRQEVGAVGARLLYPHGTVQHAGMFLSGPWNARHAFRHKHRDDPGYFGLARAQRNVTALTGACLMTRRDLFWDLGGFDEAHDITNNDLDFCLKVGRAGLSCIYAADATLIHHEVATRAPTSDHFDVDAFVREWAGVFARGDPYHHPALSAHIDDFVVDPEPAETVCAALPPCDVDSVRRIDAIAAVGERAGAMRPLTVEPVAPLPDPGLAAMFERPVVCIHPAACDEMRRWPEQHFAWLVDLLIEGEGVNVVLIGGPGDETIADAVLAKVHHRDRIAVVVGRTGAADLPGFLGRCALFVGNDGTPTHAAAAVGVPTIGVQSGNVDASEWAPLGLGAVAVRRRVECSPCYLKRPSECSRGLACLTELRPLDVYAVCRRMLALGGGAPADA